MNPEPRLPVNPYAFTLCLEFKALNPTHEFWTLDPEPYLTPYIISWTLKKHKSQIINSDY